MSNSDEIKDWVDFREATATAASSLSGVSSTATATGLPDVAEASAGVEYVIIEHFQPLRQIQQIPGDSLVLLHERVSQLQMELAVLEPGQTGAFQCAERFNLCMAGASGGVQQTVCWMALIACLVERLKGLFSINVDFGKSSE